MRSGGGAHPGTDTGSMHAGVVVRRMLDLMRDGAAGRQAQQQDDGTGHDVSDEFEERRTHRKKISCLGGQITKTTRRPSTQHSSLFLYEFPLQAPMRTGGSDREPIHHNRH